jgi:hypothetical protein
LFSALVIGSVSLMLGVRFLIGNEIDGCLWWWMKVLFFSFSLFLFCLCFFFC